jgi:hypothetical protein
MDRTMITVKCSNCVRWTKPTKNSACLMNQDNPNYIPINDYVKNEDGSLYCMDFKIKKQEAERQ